MLFWTLGFLERAAQLEAETGASPGRPPCFLIDWTDERILFHRSHVSSRPSNAWNSFFEQPGRAGFDGAARSDGATDAAPEPGGDLQREGEAARLLPASLLAERLEVGWEADRGDVSISCAFGAPAFSKLGQFRGADEGPVSSGTHGGEAAPSAFDGAAPATETPGTSALRGGRLDAATADAGRAATRRWVRVRRRVQARVERTAAELGLGDYGLGGASGWLAVHVRRTDKLEQCAANGVAEDSLSAQVRAFCAGLRCTGVLLCSDDKSLKSSLAASLRAAGLRTALVDVPLSTTLQPAHLDASLDARANAEDVLVEALLMARYCTGLLSTWSNVSVATVFFSPQGYSHAMFGDAPPAPAPREMAPASPRDQGQLAEGGSRRQVGVCSHRSGQGQGDSCTGRSWAAGCWRGARRGKHRDKD